MRAAGSVGCLAPGQASEPSRRDRRGLAEAPPPAVSWPASGPNSATSPLRAYRGTLGRQLGLTEKGSDTASYFILTTRWIHIACGLIQQGSMQVGYSLMCQALPTSYFPLLLSTRFSCATANNIEFIPTQCYGTKNSKAKEPTITSFTEKRPTCGHPLVRMG